MTDLATTNGAALEDLTEADGQRLIELERQVDKAMRSAGRLAGAALAEIRDRRLYRASHRSFEDYVLDRMGISRSTAVRMITTALGEEATVDPVAAIGAASAKAATRRHQTLDQPPVVIEPAHEPLRVAPEKPKEAPKEPEPPKPARSRLIPPLPSALTPGMGQERATRIEARNALNRVLAILDMVDPVEMAKASVKGERIRIARFAEAFANFDRKEAKQEEIIDPATCPHPENRRIGDLCGRCGAKKKARARS